MVLKRIQKSSLSLFKRNLSHSDNLTCAVKHSPEIKHNLKKPDIVVDKDPLKGNIGISMHDNGAVFTHVTQLALV